MLMKIDLRSSCRTLFFVLVWWLYPTTRFPEWYNLLNNLNVLQQIWDKMPFLKAIVQYKGELKEKRENVYTVCSFFHFNKKVNAFWMLLTSRGWRVRGFVLSKSHHGFPSPSPTPSPSFHSFHHLAGLVLPHVLATSIVDTLRAISIFWTST